MATGHDSRMQAWTSSSQVLELFPPPTHGHAGRQGLHFVQPIASSPKQRPVCCLLRSLLNGHAGHCCGASNTRRSCWTEGQASKASCRRARQSWEAPVKELEAGLKGSAGQVGRRGGGPGLQEDVKGIKGVQHIAPPAGFHERMQALGSCSAHAPGHQLQK